MNIDYVYITLTYYRCKLAFERIADRYIAIDRRIICDPDCMQIECALREKNEERVFVHRSRRIQSEVFYYADNAVLTMRSNAQKYLPQ